MFYDVRQGKLDELACAALAELHPGAIEEAVEAISKKLAKHFRRALPAAQSLLEGAAPRAWAALIGDQCAGQ